MLLWQTRGVIGYFSDRVEASLRLVIWRGGKKRQVKISARATVRWLAAISTGVFNQVAKRWATHLACYHAAVTSALKGFAEFAGSGAAPRRRSGRGAWLRRRGICVLAADREPIGTRPVAGAAVTNASRPRHQLTVFVGG